MTAWSGALKSLEHKNYVEIAVVLACYNRKETTLRCLRSLYQSVTPVVKLKVYLFDDASPDGTARVVRELYPDVRVIDGDGKQFWCGGMRAAMKEATRAPHDFLLWLNDDVDLAEGFLDVLLASHRRAELEFGDGPHVVVGAVADPNSGGITYSGYRRRSRFNPAKFTLVVPDPTQLRSCDTMNGNCVLFPAEIVKRAGEIDPAYIQQIGDSDYGYRCVKAGAKIWVAPKITGTCSPNTRFLSWDNPALSFGQRLKVLNTPHGLPIRPWLHFMSKFGGPLAVALLLVSYVKWLTISLLPRSMRPMIGPGVIHLQR